MNSPHSSDDISLFGTPQQQMAAVGRLKPSLSEVSLQLNTAKSHCTYFHDQPTTLTATVRDTLSTQKYSAAPRLGGCSRCCGGQNVVVIRAGMRSVLSAAGNHEAFFRRVQLDHMSFQSAMLLQRQCLVRGQTTISITSRQCASRTRRAS